MMHLLYLPFTTYFPYNLIPPFADNDAEPSTENEVEDTTDELVAIISVSSLNMSNRRAIMKKPSRSRASASANPTPSSATTPIAISSFPTDTPQPS